MTTQTHGIHPLDTRLKEALYSGKTLRGVFNGLASPAIVEMCAYAGFDFVVLDNEHGIADLQMTENMLRAGRASGIPMAVRCLEHDIPRILDAGAGALKIPMVNTAEHAASLVQRIKYTLPPDRPGIRGSRGSVPGVDSIFIGPNDLAHSMGCENRWNEPSVQLAIERTIKAVAAAGKCPGILALSPEEEDRYGSWGARYFASTTTGLITKAFREAALGNRKDLEY